MARTVKKNLTEIRFVPAKAKAKVKAKPVIKRKRNPAPVKPKYYIMQRAPDGKVTVAAITLSEIDAAQITSLLNSHAAKGVAFAVVEK